MHVTWNEIMSMFTRASPNPKAKNHSPIVVKLNSFMA